MKRTVYVDYELDFPEVEDEEAFDEWVKGVARLLTEMPPREVKGGTVWVVGAEILPHMDDLLKDMRTSDMEMLNIILPFPHDLLHSAEGRAEILARFMKAAEDGLNGEGYRP